MPKRTDIQSILIIGAGPIVIGQACEFDYSGAQACKALREEGYRVILVNSNPATIMTDPNMADATYIDGARHAGDGLTSLQFRRTKGGATEEIRLPIKWADVLQLERRGKTYIFSAAIYGEPFVSAQIADLDLGAEPLVGLFLS